MNLVVEQNMNYLIRSLRRGLFEASLHHGGKHAEERNLGETYKHAWKTTRSDRFRDRERSG